MSDQKQKAEWYQQYGNLNLDIVEHLERHGSGHDRWRFIVAHLNEVEKALLMLRELNRDVADTIADTGKQAVLLSSMLSLQLDLTEQLTAQEMELHSTQEVISRLATLLSLQYGRESVERLCNATTDTEAAAVIKDLSGESDPAADTQQGGENEV